MDNSTLEIEARQTYAISLMELATACDNVRNEMMAERMLYGFKPLTIWQQRRAIRKAWRVAETICKDVNRSCIDCNLQQLKNPSAFVELLVREGSRGDFLRQYAKTCYNDLYIIGDTDLVSPDDIMLRYDQQKRQKF